ncbi:hydroxyacid dehydrogenase [Candidatus Poribacteria bacterium]|nr:hydroxyacid dehydrogenase [Candidatus Poribacteria bacterium]
MSVRVHVARPLEGEELALLRAHLDEGVSLTVGPELPEPAGYELLVAGRPERALLEASPFLRAVIVPWAGIPQGTLKLMREFPAIALHNIHHNAPAAAEMAVALLLASAKVLVPRDRDFRGNGWPARMWHDRSALLLEGRRALILGFGAIGQRVARVCAALGMKVTAIRRREGTPEPPGGIAVYPAAELGRHLPGTNVLVICLPETAETDGLIRHQELELLESPSIVVNVGRGAVVDEEALYLALRDRRIAAAGLDVWWQYPAEWMGPGTGQQPSRFPFHELDNVVMSPHRGGITDQDPARRMEALAGMLNAAARGEALPNRVDLGAGY